MNLTMTRAERPACAGAAVALSRMHANTTSDADRVVRANAGPDDARAHDDVQRECRPVQKDEAVLGMVLLGIGYDITVA